MSGDKNFGGRQPGGELQRFLVLSCRPPEDEAALHHGPAGYRLPAFPRLAGRPTLGRNRRPVQPPRPGEPAVPAAAGARRGARSDQRRGSPKRPTRWPRSGRRTRRSAGSTSISRPRNCGIRPGRRVAAPRNSYELAFRNQFFTPRYVVEFLTDNTLGRIWYEMRKGDTGSRTRAGTWSVAPPRSS